MELNVLIRILIFLILTVALYHLFGKRNRLIHKNKRYLYIRTVVIILLVLLPPIMYFLIPESIGIVVKFYVVFFLSVFILVGLILFFVIEKRKECKRARP